MIQVWYRNRKVGVLRKDNLHLSDRRTGPVLPFRYMPSLGKPVQYIEIPVERRNRLFAKSFNREMERHEIAAEIGVDARDITLEERHVTYDVIASWSVLAPADDEQLEFLFDMPEYEPDE